MRRHFDGSGGFQERNEALSLAPDSHPLSPATSTTSTTYLAKANDDVISHCRCKPDVALVMWPPQMDCPWCGCGWLFVCLRCGKAFTFAKGVEIGESMQDVGRRDRGLWLHREPTEEEVAEWVQVMGILLKGVQVGRTYVYLDGYFLPADGEAVVFDGWAARHDLPRMPHAQAITDPAVLDRTLGNKEYWLQRRIEG